MSAERQIDVLVRVARAWPEAWQRAVDWAFVHNPHLIDIDRYLDAWYGDPEADGG